MGSIVGRSEYSTVNSVETSKEATELVEKKYFGIGTYFAPNEKRINGLITRIVDPKGGQQFIIKYFGESSEGGMLFEKANSNLQDAPIINPKEFSQMVGQIIQGIQFLDRYRISHRDLHRIENIFVFDNNLYKIGDFGLSSIVEKGEPTGNLSAFSAAIYAYIGEKLLGLKDIFDSMIDVKDLLARSSTINTHIKQILLEFLEIEPNALTIEHFTKMANQLNVGHSDSWF